jgi:hypothetical protein
MSRLSSLVITYSPLASGKGMVGGEGERGGGDEDGAEAGREQIRAVKASGS